MSRVLAAQVIAQKSGEAAKAGPIGLVVILILCIVCYFLFKSMSKHMRNVRETFPVETPVQRVKAPSVHPAALDETQDPALQSLTGRTRAADPQSEADTDSDASTADGAP